MSGWREPGGGEERQPDGKGRDEQVLEKEVCSGKRMGEFERDSRVLVFISVPEADISRLATERIATHHGVFRAILIH